MKSWTDFHVALTFLTPLGRARITSNEAISRSMAMYPLVGAIIGISLTLTSLLPLASWPLAWLITTLNLVLTRGLHWDGWADLWDGWGSGQRGQRFWDIVKDSHIGAFGVMGLLLGLGLQTALFERAIAHQAYAVMILAPVQGRYCCLLLARMGRDLSRPGLGQNAVHGADQRALAVGGLITLIPLLTVPAAHALISLLLTAIALYFLVKLARLQHGLNGDFLGAAIVAGEICALAPLAASHPL